MTLKIGSKAPSFALKDKDGKLHKLDTVKSDYTVLYFYPKDDTPGCTIEAKEFTATLPQFKKQKATVIGISGGDARSKKNFCNKFGLKVTLVSDPSFATAKKYGAWGKKQFMGKTYTGILRNTYLLDKNKKVIKRFDNVTPKGHTKELLAYLTTATKKGAGVKAGVKATVARPAKMSKAKTTARKATKSAGKRSASARGRTSTRKVTRRIASRKVSRTSARGRVRR